MRYFYQTTPDGGSSEPTEIFGLNDDDIMLKLREAFGEDLSNIMIVYEENSPSSMRVIWQCSDFANKMIADCINATDRTIAEYEAKEAILQSVKELIELEAPALEQAIVLGWQMERGTPVPVNNTQYNRLKKAFEQYANIKKGS